VSFGLRLREIHDGISAVIAEHRPGCAAVEDVFVAHNPRSALKLGQARGAAVLTLLLAGLEVWDYTPMLIKQSVTGYGRADKAQVQHMVQVLLELEAAPSPDAADGLAVALCHARGLAVTRGVRR
jgi:crossover junction endodeoxyribonuclease RuvC